MPNMDQLSGSPIVRVSYGKTCEYHYDKINYIDKGAFGAVYKAEITAPGNLHSEVTAMAIKVSYKNPQEMSDEKGVFERWNKLIGLKHEHLISYHKIVAVETNSGMYSVEILMDLCAGKDRDLGKLLGSAERDRKALSQEESLCFSVQIAGGLAYLSDQNIVHGDLKPTNVLVKHTTNEHRTLLICDLDDVVLTRDKGTTTAGISHPRGTIQYMSPEMLKFSFGPSDDKNEIGRRTDVWSLGWIILELFDCSRGVYEQVLHKDGEEDFPLNKGEKHLAYQFPNKIISGWLPVVAHSIPNSVTKCIKSCLQAERTKRIWADDIRRTLTELLLEDVSANNTDDQKPCFCINRGSKVSTVQLLDPVDGQHLIHRRKSFGSYCQYSYSLNDIVSRGVFGTVYKAIIKDRGNFDGEDHVAIKVVHLSHYDSNTLRDEDTWNGHRKKWEFLLRLKHRNLVVVHKVTTADVQEGTSIEFMTDFCEGGDLQGLLSQIKEGNTVSSPLASICYAVQMADGLRYLHQRGVVHGNIKPASVFVKSRRDTHRLLQIGDLNNVVPACLPQDARSSTDAFGLRYAIRYASPEMLRREFTEESENVIGRKTDVWSMGSTIHAVLSAATKCHEMFLYNHITKDHFEVTDNTWEYHFVAKILDGYVPYIDSSVPEYIARHLRCCFKVDPKIRMSAAIFLEEVQRATVNVVASNTEEAQQCVCCRELLKSELRTYNTRLCAEFAPEDVVLVIHSFPAQGSLCSIGLQLLEPYSCSIRQMELVGSLHHKAFLRSFVAVNNEILLHVKTLGSNIETVSYSIFAQTYSPLFCTPSLNMMSAVAHADKIYYWNKFYPLSPLKVLDVTERTTAELSAPQKITDAKLVKYGEKIVCCGNDGCDPAVQCYDIVANQWESGDIPPMPQPRSSYALAELGEYVYVLGGSVTIDGWPTPSSTCLRLNMETLSWETISSLLLPRVHHGAFVYSKRIYVFGGQAESTSDEDLSQTLEVYEVEKNTWLEIRLTNLDHPKGSNKKFVNCETQCLLLQKTHCSDTL